MAGRPDHDSQREGLVGLEHLPVELLLEIAASGLVLEDFTACAQVSRKWNAAWTQPAVAAALCRRFFPTQPGPHTFSAFQKKCRKFFRRRHGKHTVVDLTWVDWSLHLPCHFRPDPDVHPDGSCPEQGGDQVQVMAYGGGNIVWNEDQGEVIFIDNLYTRKRKALKGSTWGFEVSRIQPYACAVGESLLAREVGHSDKGYPIFIYHLGTNVGVKYVFEEPESEDGHLPRWLSIRTWGEKVFITSGPSSIHVFSHDGASLSLTHVIDPYGSLAPDSPWHGFTRGGREHPRNEDRTNFLPNPRDDDGVFIVVKGLVPGAEVDGPYSHFLVREFSGAKHVATYACDIEETMRGDMEKFFGKYHHYVDRELAAARVRAMPDRLDGDWADEKDEWAGVYGSDEGMHEIFRFVYKAHEYDGPGPLFNWWEHFQVSVTFCTTTRRFELQSAYIDDGSDRDGSYNDEWIPRGCMLRNGQFLRVYYDSGERALALPTIVTRDIGGDGWERTRRWLGKREDLYPLEHENKNWHERNDPNIHLGFFHDEDFTVLWNRQQSDLVVFDFRESGGGTES